MAFSYCFEYLLLLLHFDYLGSICQVLVFKTFCLCFVFEDYLELQIIMILLIHILSQLVILSTKPPTFYLELLYLFFSFLKLENQYLAEI